MSSLSSSSSCLIVAIVVVLEATDAANFPQWENQLQIIMDRRWLFVVLHAFG